MGIKSFVRRLTRPLITIIDRVFADECMCSIGDIILRRGEMNANQFLLTTRTIDVEHYINGDCSFFFQTTISRKAYGNDYNESLANESFAKLIESYKGQGYDSRFPVTVDSKINLCDGNHRIGCNLFFGIAEIRIHRVRYHLTGLDFTTDYWKSYLLSSSFMQEVYCKYEKIQNWLVDTGNTFVAIAPNRKGNNSFESDINNLVNVLRIHTLDDNMTLCQFWLSDPDYCICNNTLISKAAKRIGSVLASRFGEKTKVSLNCLQGKHLYESHLC